MARKQKDPLRMLTADESQFLERVSRSGSAPASHVARAKALLVVSRGHSYAEAARLAGRRSGDAVSMLVSRFNREGIEAIEPRHGGGPPAVYKEPERERILREARRTPDRAQDGTATWTLRTLQRALRQAPDGLPEVSVYTIRATLLAAGWSHQRDGTWCETGRVKRKRKGQLVTVIDPDTEAKKTRLNELTE
jgi:transposase